MQGILDLLMSNPLYMVGAGILGLVVLVFLLKKVFKIMIVIIVVALAYGGYLYMTEKDPMKTLQKNLDKGKSTINEIDDATKDIRRETLDKVIDDVDKKLKENAKKK
ncbi:hypothetical protein HQ531_02375 [bacterium]|nr:hypothetical protein [bacterium]